MKKISIIIVCLNAGDDLLYTVSETLKQTYQHYEIIVKDGLSSDGSIEKLPNDIHLKIVQKRDRGIYDAMNQATELASGDFCMFINSGDSLYNYSTLWDIVGFIAKDEADFYYGKSRTLSSGVINYGPKKITPFFCYRSTMCHQAMIIKTTLLKNRGYNIQYKVSADREWFLYAFLDAKVKFQRIPIFVSNYKGGGFSAGIAAQKTGKKEDKLINRSFFNKLERFKYGFLWLLTLPHLRQWVSKSHLFKKFYFKIRYNYLNRG